MKPIPNRPERSKPAPTFIIPAVLALAGFTLVGLLLVEQGRTETRAQAETFNPLESPIFLDAAPGSASPPAPTSKPALPRPSPIGRSSPALALVEVRPGYPRIAKIMRTQGPVEVALRLDAQGHPVQATVLSGNALLRGEALRAARSWTFAPALENGRAVPSDFRVRFEFRLA